MKYSKSCVEQAIRTFLPSYDITPGLQIPEALNAAAVEAFLIGAITAEQIQSRQVMRTAIKELRKAGELTFGTGV